MQGRSLTENKQKGEKFLNLKTLAANLQLCQHQQQQGTQFLKKTVALSLVVTTLFNTSCTAAETTSTIKCEALGDSIIATNTGDLILEPRLIKYEELEEYGSNMSGKRGGQRALCTIKNDPPGYKWVSCSKDGKDYTTYIMGSREKIFEIEEAIANRIQHRGWSGACKVKL